MSSNFSSKAHVRGEPHTGVGTCLLVKLSDLFPSFSMKSLLMLASSGRFLSVDLSVDKRCREHHKSIIPPLVPSAF